MVSKAVIGCFLITLLLFLIATSVSASDDVNFTLYWAFDNPSYCIKDTGELDVEIENTGVATFYITWVGVHFEWEEEGYYFALDFSDNPIEVSPGETVPLGTIEFEVFENAEYGKNTYYLLVEYAYWENGNLVSEEWRTEDFIIRVAEPLTVIWWLEKEKTSYFKGEKILYTLNITNNCNRCVRILSVGARGDWLPEGTYYWTDYPEAPVIEPGGYLLFSDLELQVPKTAEIKWHNIKAMVGYQIEEERGWSDVFYYEVPEWYAVEVLERKFPTLNLREIIEILSGIGAAIGLIAGILKKIVGKREQNPPPPPPNIRLS